MAFSDFQLIVFPEANTEIVDQEPFSDEKLPLQEVCSKFPFFFELHGRDCLCCGGPLRWAIGSTAYSNTF